MPFHTLFLGIFFASRNQIGGGLLYRYSARLSVASFGKCRVPRSLVRGTAMEIMVLRL